MLVVRPNCKVCTRCKVDKKLLNRIYNSKYYIPHGDEPLSAIERDYKAFFSGPALRNHCLKHQFIDSTAYTDALVKRADKMAENRVVKRAIKANEAVQSVIDAGFDRLEAGKITVSTNELLRASQIKLAAEAKQKDQQLAMVEMIAHFASGSAKNERIYVKPDSD